MLRLPQLAMPHIELDGPSAAIVIRDVSRMLNERGLRFLVPIMLGVNALIAYALLSIPTTGMDRNEHMPTVVASQWMAVYAIGLVLVAARSGTSIGTERSRDTWTLLRVSPARAVELVFGYIASGLSAALIFTFSQMPLLLIFVYCAPAMTVKRLGVACIIGVCSWIACAAWCVWMTAAIRRTVVAVGATVAAAFWSVGYIPLVIAALIRDTSTYTGMSTSISGPITDFFYALSPIQQLIGLITGAPNISSQFVIAMIANTLIPFYFAVRAVRREFDPSLATSDTPSKQRWFGFRARTRDRSPIDEAHPIYALERRSTKAAKGILTRLALILIGGYAILMGITAGSSETRDPELFFVVYFAFMGMAIWRSAISVSVNREQETFDMLAMTGLRAHEIVRDLAYAGALAVRPLGVLLLLMAGSATWGAYYFGNGLNPREVLFVFAFLFTLALCVVTQLSCGLFSSIAAKGARESVILSVVLSFLMYIGIPLLIVSILWGIDQFVTLDPAGIATTLGITFSMEYLNMELIAGCSTPYFGLLALLDNGNEIPPWSWFVAMGVSLCWTGLWYAASLFLMRRRLAAQSR